MSDKIDLKSVYSDKQAIWKTLVIRGELELIKQHSLKADELIHVSNDININRSLGLYRAAETNAWIYKTLSEQKKLRLFNTCNNLVMVGAGMYPYSMFDIHKKHKHIKQVGLEIDKNRAAVSQKIVTHSPARNEITILNCDGAEYDYSYLGDNDLIFISCDVDAKNILKTVAKTSKAHFFICAPYKGSWVRSLLLDLGISYDKNSGHIVKY